MKDEKYVTNKITTSEKFDVVNMGISDDPEDQKMILNILTNTLYTNKVAAVLREYGCNAADANTEAGKADVPITVHIPTPGEPFFSVRDVGGGMDEQQILKVFCRLGRSTKRNSNAFTGMLGIGSKAGFAYGNSFLVTSFNKGTRTVYNCFRDAVGLPQMAKMDSSPTTEEDGIEIKLSVKSADVHQFQQTAHETYKYFRVPPVGVPRAARKVVCQGKNWRLVTGRQYTAIMGNVGYDINADYVFPILNAGSYGIGYGIGVELDFEIGELEIAANREGLQYKEHTQKALKQRVKDIIAELPAEITKMVSTAASLWEARCVYHGIHKNFPRLAPSKSIKWQGQELSLNFELPSGGPKEDFTIIQWGKRTYGKSLRKQYPVRIIPTTSLFLRDKCSYTGRRLKEFFSSKSKTSGEDFDYLYGMESNNAILFHFKTDAAKKTFWKKHDLDGAKLTPISTLPLPPVTSISTPRVFNNKYTAEVFMFTPPGKGARYHKNSDYWTVSTQSLKTGKGVYVPIYSFDLCDGCYLPTFMDQLTVLKDLKLFTSPLYGVKEQSVRKLGTGWTTLTDHLKKAFESLIQDKTYAQNLANHNMIATHQNFFSKDTDEFPAESVAAKYMKLKKETATKHTKLFEMIVRGQFKPWLEAPSQLPKPTIDLNKLSREIKQTYPMFKAMHDWTIKALPMDAVVEYVTLIENSKRK
jgi:hypothetical protein